MSRKKKLKIIVLMHIEGDETPCRVETECDARNVDFLWGSITAQCEDVDSYAYEQRALGGEDDDEPKRKAKS